MLSSFVAGLVIGAVVGALVARRNANKVNAVVDAAKVVAVKLKL